MSRGTDNGKERRPGGREHVLTLWKRNPGWKRWNNGLSREVVELRFDPKAAS